MDPKEFQRETAVVPDDLCHGGFRFGITKRGPMMSIQLAPQAASEMQINYEQLAPVPPDGLLSE